MPYLASFLFFGISINEFNTSELTVEILILISKLFGGIGLFLFAMYLIEEALKNLSGRNFKLFLQRVSKNRLGAVAGGAIVTGVLQSSSMVSLMVLAFVGAEIFTMKDAMAIILGANLGTTLDSWVVATLGFKMNIEVIAYPAVGFGGLLLILFGKHKTIKYISWFLFGFGLLFIGLAFMKAAMEEQVRHFDFSNYASMPLIMFLGIGFLITLLVQSSSVTMALTLSALHAGAIDFPHATAIVLGSETGTTLKILLSAIGGNVSKKRVALGNFFFNIALTALAFPLLKPILLLITDVFGISDHLIGLVTFSSLVNLFSIVVFLPFLGLFTKLLEKFFTGADASASAFISHANVGEPETALDLFRRETRYFVQNALLFNLELFEIKSESLPVPPEFINANERKKFYSKTPEEKYEFLKQLQGELQAFYLEFRSKIQEDQESRLNQLISSVRSTMHAVKSIKDIGTNIIHLSNSSADLQFAFYLEHKKETLELYQRLNALLNEEQKADFETLQKIHDGIQENYSSALNEFYKSVQDSPIAELDITSAMNFNRSLFTSNKAFLMAVKDFLLEEKQAIEFNEIPVYKT